MSSCLRSRLAARPRPRCKVYLEVPNLSKHTKKVSKTISFPAPPEAALVVVLAEEAAAADDAAGNEAGNAAK